MTWNTPSGDRILSQPEADLFCSCLGTMIDYDTHDGEGLNWGIPLVRGPFQRLTDPQKYTVLEEVTKQLITDTPVPTQTAITESAIYYVFCWLKQEFDEYFAVEVWGESVLNVLADEIAAEQKEEKDEGEASFWPDLECYDMNKWCRAIDYIADKILWDRDWEMEDRFPAVKGNYSPIMRIAGIDPDYFAPFEGRARPGARDRLERFIDPWCK